MQEKFSTIEGFPDYYILSNYGYIKSLSRKDDYGRNLKEKILTSCYGKDGIHRLRLRTKSTKIKYKSVSIHTLVATTFLGYIPDTNTCLIFIDGNKSNNRADNLKSITRRQAHSFRPKDNSFVGVSYNKDKNIYSAKITFNGTKIHLFSSKDKSECYRVYELAKINIENYYKQLRILNENYSNNIVKSKNKI